MRSWRIGTISMGAALLLMGLGLLYAQLNEHAVLEWAIHWWPLIFIMLGAEVLWQSYQAKKKASQISYDIFSVFIIGILLCFGLGMQALSETGVLQQGRIMLTVQNYELQQEAAEIPINSGIKEVIIEDSSCPLLVYSRPGDKITAAAHGFVSASSRPAAMQILRQNQSVNTRQDGDTLYISFASATPASSLTPGLLNIKYVIYLPQQLKVSVHSNYSDIQIHAKDITGDWYIKDAGNVSLDIPSKSNLQLAARVNNKDELQGNASWQVKEPLPVVAENTEIAEDGTSSLTEGSLMLGSGQHKMLINCNGSMSVDLLP